MFHHNSCLSPTTLPFQRANTLQSQSNEFFPKLPSDHSIDSRLLSEKREDEMVLSKAGSRPGLEVNQNVETDQSNRILLNDEAIRGDDLYNDNMNNESDFNQSGVSQQRYNISNFELKDIAYLVYFFFLQ